VLEEEEYLRRKEYYNSTGQRHYYFMNVGNGEVIDACRKVRGRLACRHGIGWRGFVLAAGFGEAAVASPHECCSCSLRVAAFTP